MLAFFQMQSSEFKYNTPLFMEKARKWTQEHAVQKIKVSHYVRDLTWFPLIEISIPGGVMVFLCHDFLPLLFGVVLSVNQLYSSSITHPQGGAMLHQ